MNAGRPRLGPALALAALVVVAALPPRAAAPQVPVPQTPPVQQPATAQQPQAAQQQPPQQPLPSFRAGVDIVSLNVTVTEPDGRYVTDLDAGNFEVFEDGVKQDVDVLQPHEPARSRWRCCSTRAPAWKTGCRRRRRRRSASPGGCGRRTWPNSSTSTAASR